MPTKRETKAKVAPRKVTSKARSKRPAAYKTVFSTDETDQVIEINVVDSTWNWDPPESDNEGPGIEIKIFPNDGSNTAEFGFALREADAEQVIEHLQAALRNLKERST